MSNLSIVKQLVTGVQKHFGGYDYAQQVPLDPSTYRNESLMYFFAPDGKEYAFDATHGNGILRAYCDCPPLAATINRKGNAYMRGRTWVMNTRGKEATGYNADKLNKLLSKPNAIQSWQDFEIQGYIYQQLFGYNIILTIKPAGFSDNIDASALWNVPPFMLDIRESNKLFYQTDISGIIEKITLSYKGTMTDIPVKDVFIMKDYTPSFSNVIFPGSRMEAIRTAIANVIDAYASRQQIMLYRGAQGIFTRDPDPLGSLPVTQKERDEINVGFQRYGLMKGQFQFAITSAALKFQQVSRPMKDLMLFEEVEASTMAICDAYGYPYRLLSQEKSPSYNDVNEFKKMLYQDTIIPEANSNYAQWNRFFETEKYNLKIEKDYSAVEVLQEDKQKQATARMTNARAVQVMYKDNLITLNRAREIMEEDTVPGDDTYYRDTESGMLAMEAQRQTVNNQNTGNGNNNQA